MQIVAGQGLVNGPIVKAQDNAAGGIGQRDLLADAVDDGQIGALHQAQAHGLLPCEDGAGGVAGRRLRAKGLPSQTRHLKAAVDDQFTAPGHGEGLTWRRRLGGGKGGKAHTHAQHHNQNHNQKRQTRPRRA
ncbi:MAG: hypothetical protein D6790_00140 [Caldilineae bacterium]|nr:MAG: hypothetical protein D6790_00140 [Caldilineae bacterium]